MNSTVLISLPIDELQTVIIDCVNSCLRHQQKTVTTTETTEQPEKFLNIQEAAKLLNLSVPTLYSKVSKRELPCMKQGKRLYFSQTDLINYIKEGKKKTFAEIEAEADAYLSNNKKGLNNGI